MAERFSTGLRNEVGKSGGSSYADALVNGVIYLYSGTQPASADAAEPTGSTLLCIISESGGTFTPDSATNGINLDAASGGVVSKAAGETWEGTNLADGTIGWGRFYANDRTQGASTTAVRFDFAVSQSGAEVTASNTYVTTDETTTLTSFSVTLPAG